MLKKTILLGALSTCMYGCQSGYIVQYDSAPQSAMGVIVKSGVWHSGRFLC